LTSDINFGPGLCEEFVNFVDGKKWLVGRRLNSWPLAHWGTCTRLAKVPTW